MKLSDFDYPLSPDRIAQFPVEPRDTSKLLVLEKKTGHIEHRIFHELPQVFRSGDLLVGNKTKVFPARLVGQKESTGAKVEFLLLHPISGDHWKVLIKRIKRARPNQRFVFGPGFSARIVEVLSDGMARVQFESETPLSINLNKFGSTPLPPYIRRNKGKKNTSDKNRYQTVYAEVDGSVAAPTAGLHFTPSLIQKLSEKGIRFEKILLHVGYGTFKPVRTENAEDYILDPEWIEITSSATRTINGAKRDRKRIVAVGTTTTRTLESATDESGNLSENSGLTNCYILPGYRFKTVDALITNFHLPKSTLLMLVCAFAGKANILKAYQEAIDRGYRFYSYGDAMLIV